MTNIKNLQMWDSICNDTRIGIVKSFFGLRSKIVYLPTKSEIDVKEVELTPNDGHRIKAFLETPHIGLAKVISGFRPEKVDLGNYMLELCVSRDGNFAIAQLFQFVQLRYEPVTRVIAFEGEDARVFGQMF